MSPRLHCSEGYRRESCRRLPQPETTDRGGAKRPRLPTSPINDASSTEVTAIGWALVERTAPATGAHMAGGQRCAVRSDPKGRKEGRARSDSTCSGRRLRSTVAHETRQGLKTSQVGCNSRRMHHSVLGRTRPHHTVMREVDAVIGRGEPIASVYMPFCLSK